MTQTSDLTVQDTVVIKSKFLSKAQRQMNHSAQNETSLLCSQHSQTHISTSMTAAVALSLTQAAQCDDRNTLQTVTEAHIAITNTVISMKMSVKALITFTEQINLYTAFKDAMLSIHC